MDYTQFRREFSDGNAVSVNHKALITRALTKYPVDFALFRELLQNSADAQAQSALIEFETDENISITENVDKIHSCLVKRLRFQNTGLEFQDDDWNRLREIASGNPNEGKIGAFGVGFYSVFELTDEPLVHSGNRVMAFRYKDVQLHYDFRQVPVFQKGTLIDLVYKEPAPLPELPSFVGFLIQSFMMVNLFEIRLVLKSPSGKIDLLHLTKKNTHSASISPPERLAANSPNKIFSLGKIVRSDVTVKIRYLNATQQLQDTVASKLFSFGKKLMGTLFTGSDNPGESTDASVAVTRVDGFFDVTVSKEFSRRMKETILKPPPRRTTASLLMFPGSADGACVDSRIESYVFPRAFNDAKVFVGFPTKQSTGLKSHLALNQAVPTMERTALDMSNAFVKEWNRELFFAAGILCRCVYEYELGRTAASASEHSYEEALRIVSRFQFGDSAPDALVGALVRSGFWECSRVTWVPTKMGILINSKVKLPEAAAPILRVTPFVSDADLVAQLKDLKLVSTISLKDIVADLASSKMDAEFASTVVHWLSEQCNKRTINPQDARLCLGAVKIDWKNALVDLSPEHTLFYLDSTLPYPEISSSLPENCLDNELASMLGSKDLLRLGYKPLPLEEWASSRIKEDPKSVLEVCSRAWSMQTESTRGNIVRLFENTECIPTSYGMMYPREVYVRQVKLFPLLPVAQLDLPPSWLKEVGVRESVDMQYVLEALQSKTLRWKNEDLVQYLVSNSKELRAEDWKLLRSGPFFSDSKGKLCCAQELYAPDSVLSKLSIPTIAYPKWDEGSAEARLLFKIGLRDIPPFSQVFEAEKRFLESGSQEKNQTQFLALKYFVQKSAEGKYSIKDISDREIVGSSTGFHKPVDVFADPRLSLFAFPVIHPDLLNYRSILGVRERPPLQSVLSRFLGTYRTLLTDHAKLEEVMSFLSSMSSELTQHDIRTLKDTQFIPLFKKSGTVWHSPSMIFFPNSSQSDDMAFLRPVLPTISLSQSARPFLLALGVSDRPTQLQVMELLATKPREMFDAIDSTSKYIAMLLTLHANWPQLSRNVPLIQRLKSTPFLIGIVFKPTEKGGLKREVSLYKPSEISIVDKVAIFNQFKTSTVTAPQNKELELFYEDLGAPRLTDLVHETIKVGEIVANESLRRQFEEHVQARLKIYAKNAQRDDVFKHNPGEVKVTLVKRIDIQRSLPRQRPLLVSSSAYMNSSMQLYVAEPPSGTFSAYKWLDMATTLCEHLARRPSQDTVIVLEVILSQELESLELKGYNIERAQASNFDDEFNFKVAESDSGAMHRPGSSSSSAGTVGAPEKAPPNASSETELRATPKSPVNQTPSVHQGNSSRDSARSSPQSGQKSQGSLGTAKKSLWSTSLNPFRKSSTEQASRPIDARTPGAVPRPPLPMVSGSGSSHLPSQASSTPRKVSSETAGHGAGGGASSLLRTLGQQSLPSGGGGEGASLNPQDALRLSVAKIRACTTDHFNSPQHVDTFSPQVKESPTDINLKLVESGKVNVYATDDLPAPQQSEGELTSTLLELASVFGCSEKSVNLFREQGSRRIAFNRGGSLFFNSCHEPPSEVRLRDYYYTIFAHELAHNGEQSHGAVHTSILESLIQATLDRFAHSSAPST